MFDMKTALMAVMVVLVTPALRFAETPVSETTVLQGKAVAIPVQSAPSEEKTAPSSEVIQWKPEQAKAEPQRQGLQKVWHTVFDKHPAHLERPAYSPSSGSMMLNFTQGSSSAEYGY
jgi:hypothetical protein